MRLLSQQTGPAYEGLRELVDTRYVRSLLLEAQTASVRSVDAVLGSPLLKTAVRAGVRVDFSRKLFLLATLKWNGAGCSVGWGILLGLIRRTYLC